MRTTLTKTVMLPYFVSQSKTSGLRVDNVTSVLHEQNRGSDFSRLLDPSIHTIGSSLDFMSVMLHSITCSSRTALWLGRTRDCVLSYDLVHVRAAITIGHVNRETGGGLSQFLPHSRDSQRRHGCNTTCRAVSAVGSCRWPKHIGYRLLTSLSCSRRIMQAHALCVMFRRT